MSLAFGVSEEDVATVLALSFGMRQLDDDTIADYFDHIDGDEVEKAALYGNSMDEQTEYAYNDIARQLLPIIAEERLPDGAQPLDSMRLQSIYALFAGEGFLRALDLEMAKHLSHTPAATSAGEPSTPTP